MKKTAFILIGVIIFLVVAGLITKAIIEKVTRNITEREIRRITGEETDEIMRGISSSADTLKEVSCDKQALQLPPDAYTGLLIDSHLHMPFTFNIPKAMYAQADFNAPILEKDVPAGQIICILDDANISTAFGFYIIPNLLKGSALQQVKAVNGKYPDRIQPFIMPAHISSLDLKPSEYDNIITSNKGLFKGIGELAFYKGSLKGISPDDRIFMEIYNIASKHNIIVMIHPDNGQQEAVERVLKKNPTVKFLFHGNFEMGPYAAEIVGKYPNAYFTIDTDLSEIAGNHVSLYNADSKEQFIAEFKKYFEEVQQSALAKWKTAIEKHPDQFLWGTDRAFAWHFDTEVGALIEKMARTFIGQLEPAAQEKFAYKNAEKIMKGNQS